MTFRENLRNLRKEKNYSQEYLAEKMDVTRQTISKWENGTVVPNMKKLSELAELFEVSINDLLGNEYASEIQCEYITDVYTKDEVHAMLESVKSHADKKSKTLSVCVVLLVIAQIISCVCFGNTISSLNSQIANLNNAVSLINDNQNGFIDDDYDHRSDFVNYTVVKTYPDKPHIVNARFKYAPESYSKTDKVYFQVPTSEGLKKVAAENHEGIFTASADIDLTKADQTSYLCIENGDKVDLVDICAEYLPDYKSFSETSMYADVESYTGYNNSEITVTFDNQYVQWNENHISGKIVSATLHIKTDLKKEFTKDLPIKKDDENHEYSHSITIDDATIQDARGAEKIYIDLVDENGVIYRLNVGQIVIYGNNDNPAFENESDSFMQYIFTIDGKQVAVVL